jgi:uncharacterized protein (TIGR00297 family)
VFQMRDTNFYKQVGFAASFASKLADTTSSEIGKAYGQTTYLITNFRRVPRGTEGAVSLEGTLAGVAAAAGVGVMALALGQVSRLLASRIQTVPWVLLVTRQGCFLVGAQLCGCGCGCGCVCVWGGGGGHEELETIIISWP